MYNSELSTDEDDARDVLDDARRNIREWYTYFSKNYVTGQSDKRFALLRQWSDSEAEEIKRLGLPALQFNKLYDYCKKTIGENRNITPALQVRSKKYVSDDDDQKNIDLQKRINLMQNLLRSLAYNSESQLAYQTAFENAIYSGYGAVHIKYEYEDAHTFDKKISVCGVAIPEKAFFDPTSVKPTKTDGDYCGVYYTMDKRLFKKMYPDVPFPESFSEELPDQFWWSDKDSITIVDYYCKHQFKRKLVQLDNGQVLEKDKLDEYMEMVAASGDPIPYVSEERDADDYKIVHYKLIRDTILEQSDHPSKILPVIFVDGDSFIWKGQQYTQSFVRQAIDAQRFLNYTGIAIAQGLKNARKEQFMVTKEQIKGFEGIWTNPELYQGALPYNYDAKAGKPDKLPTSEIPQSLYQNYERANNDIQSVLGLYDANMGAPTSEVSGKAINAKQQAGNLASSIYRDNLIRAIEDVGRAILSMVPTVYDTERNVSLLSQDGQSSVARVNMPQADGTVKNDVREEIFDLSVEAGPSYALQKQAALELLMQLAGVNPNLFPLVADLIADNLEIENRPQLVERLRSLVPPAILAKERGDPPPPPPGPSAVEQAQMAQFQLKQKELDLKTQEAQSDAAIENRRVDVEEHKLVLDIQQNELDKIKVAVQAQDAQAMAHAKNLEAIAEMARTAVESRDNRLNNMTKMMESTQKIVNGMNKEFEHMDG